MALVLLNSSIPVFGAASVMGQRDNHDSTLIWEVHERNRNIHDQDSPSVRYNWGTGRWNSTSTSGGFFNGSSKSSTQSGLLAMGVHQLRKECSPRGRDEPCTHHRDRRRASANTSFAGQEGVSPRSNAATRHSIASAQAASTSETGACKDSSIDSAGFARSSALSA